MRETMKTRKMKEMQSRKRKRVRGFGGIESTSLPVIKTDVMVKTPSVLPNTHSLNNNRITIAVVGEVDGDIYKFPKKGLLANFKDNQSFREAVMSGTYFHH